MADFSSTLAPNRRVLANTGNINAPIGCALNGASRRAQANEQRIARARATPNAICGNPATGNAAGQCGGGCGGDDEGC